MLTMFSLLTLTLRPPLSLFTLLGMPRLLSLLTLVPRLRLFTLLSKAIWATSIYGNNIFQKGASLRWYDYKAFWALKQKVEWMDTPETTTTRAPAVPEIYKKKTTKTFPEEVVIEAKFQVLVSCLDGGGQHKWWIRGKTANWSKTYGKKNIVYNHTANKKILSAIIRPRKNIVCNHIANKKILPLKEYCCKSKYQHIVNIRKVFGSTWAGYLCVFGIPYICQLCYTITLFRPEKVRQKMRKFATQ